jgi:hypothetical protein
MMRQPFSRLTAEDNAVERRLLPVVVLLSCAVPAVVVFGGAF